MTLRLFAILALLLTAARTAAMPSDAERHFLDKVKPLLDSRCVSCHGPDKQKGSLRLDTRAALLKGGDTGPGIVPGKPADSLILKAVMHTAAGLEMPPKERLTPADVAVLERWIGEGAPWPHTPAPSTQPALAPAERLGDAWTDPRNPIVRIFGGQRLDLWSLKPLARPEPPAVRRTDWPRNANDRFSLSRLEAANLAPAPEADRRTLIRRVSYGLTGLPPTPEEVSAFVNDAAPDAYERLVDRLLASPRYGEHQARLWLDVIRYSDSNGFDWDEFRPHAWRFRDYVVRSFNADKPFDRFVREQLAGDELLDGPPKTAAEQDLLIATGYLRLGPHDNAAPLFNEQSRSRAELMADLTETTASAFLALTMSCCRCHDHKYDPLSQADHYRLRAFFEPVKFADDLHIDLAPEQQSIREQHESIDAQIKPLQDQLDAITKAARDRLGKEKPEAKEIDAALSEQDKAAQKSLAKQIEALKKQKRPFTKALLMTDAGGKPPVTKVLFQGDHKQEREPVPPGFISVIDANPAEIRKPLNPKTTGRRLTLAEWIVFKDNPLTARVLANRVWQQHFGQGLVSTPNDFGLAGARPAHPELLDHLASQIITNNWSLKTLHRQILTSSTYRQSSSHAPGRSAPGTQHLPVLRRLSAEQLRDSLLAVSGLLTHRAGGPPVWPPLPADILQANPAFLDDNAEKTKGWYPSPADQQNVRSLYLIQKRTVRLPLMETFDLPDNSVSCPRRTESTVAPQALSLLNGGLTGQAAKAFAERVEKRAGPEPSAQVRAAFSLAYQRDPGPDEHEACLKLLRSRSLPELCRALLNANEFLYLD